MDTALDQNQSELRVLVLAVPLQVLAHSDSLLDQVVQVLGDLGTQTYTWAQSRQPSSNAVSVSSSWSETVILR